MTWWQKLFYGFNTTVEEEDGKGEVSSPEFIKQLQSEGYDYDNKWFWWVREWTTSVPEGKKSILEVYRLRIKTCGGRLHPDVKTEFGKDWSYMIINPEGLPKDPYGGWGGNTLVWGNDIGEQE